MHQKAVCKVPEQEQTSVAKNLFCVEMRLPIREKIIFVILTQVSRVCRVADSFRKAVCKVPEQEQTSSAKTLFCVEAQLPIREKFISPKVPQVSRVWRVDL